MRRRRATRTHGRASHQRVTDTPPSLPRTLPSLPPTRPGADPMTDLLSLADDLRFSKKFEKASLGQGQGPKAERLLAAGMERGLWVCLQNCHLAASWLPALECIVEGIQPDKVRLETGLQRLRGAGTRFLPALRNCMHGCRQAAAWSWRPPFQVGSCGS